MAECLVSILLVAGLVVVALDAAGGAMVGRQRIGDRSRGQLLAQDLMTEILAQRYEEPVDAPSFGLEGTEVTTKRDEFDDVDDYHGWQGAPPQRKGGVEMPEHSDWRREVIIEYADPYNLLATLATDSGIKRITVTVKKNDIVVASMVAIRTFAAENLGAR
jgi:hypothetical protein